MGLMAAIAVVVAVLAALTLLPARARRCSGRASTRCGSASRPSTEQAKGLWARWADGDREPSADRRPRGARDPDPADDPAALADLGQQDIGALSTSTTARRAYDLLAQNFGAGVNGPLLVAVSLGSPAERASDPRLQTLQKDVASTPGVAGVSPMQIDKAGTTAYFNAISKARPVRQHDDDLVDIAALERDPEGRAAARTCSAHVGGSTAGYDRPRVDGSRASCRCRSSS